MDVSFTRILVGKSIIRATTVMFATFFAWRIIVKYNAVFLVSILPALSTIGYIVVSIPEGYILDKFERTRVMFISTILSFFTYLPLLFSSSLIVIYVVDLLSAVFSFVVADIFQTIIKDLINTEELAKAFSYSTIGDAIAGILGVLVGGASAALFPTLFPEIIVLTSLAAIPLTYLTKITTNRRNNLNYSHAFKIIRLLLPFLLVTLVINGIFTIIDVYAPAYFYDILHSSALAYTAFILAYLIGSLIGGSIASKIAKKLLDPKVIAVTVGSFSAIFYLIAMVKIVYIQPVFTLIMGIETSLINISLGAMFTRIIPSEILGRVNSITMIFLTSSSPVMAIIYGVLTNFLSIQTVFLAVGIAMIFLAIPTFTASKRILNLKEEDIKNSIKLD